MGIAGDPDDPAHHSPTEPLVQHPVPDNYHAVPMADSNVPMPHQIVKPTNFSTVSAISENLEQEDVLSAKTPQHQFAVFNPVSEFCPPKASTAVRGTETTPPPVQNPDVLKRQRTVQSNINDYHQGGSYLSSASSNANSWSFEVFGKNQNEAYSVETEPCYGKINPVKDRNANQSQQPLNDSYRNFDFGNGDYPERVLYKPRQSVQQPHISSSMEANNITPPRRNPRSNFMETGGVSNDQQLAQMNILYEARGNRIKELQNEMEMNSTESAKQLRILQHQLSMSEGKPQICPFLHNCSDPTCGGNYILKWFFCSVNFGRSIYSLQRNMSGIIKKLVQRRIGN